ncbi:transcription initiation factor TFIID subunit 12-like [Paramacrobiotus metropolitanus]|uniref:transcription initiation factor TFIID subunit 12-like n=1 Tax=Paramacrobiotus metropolitanus TaxID=2943436 RepID=UPI0024460F26|nr:transcription initiation factor TFIID subunit 12-like [Paramacrobiotus metropolitanus]
MQRLVIVCILLRLEPAGHVAAQHLLLPAGEFKFLRNNLPFFVPAPSQSATPSSPVVSPEQVQPANSRSATADLFSAETAELAFVRRCAGHVSKAGLLCPCAAPGHSCAPAYSVCSDSKQCVCDPALSYVNATKTGCTPYPTTTAATTTASAAVTCPTCQCPTLTCPAVTCPAVTCPTTPQTTCATCPVCSTPTTTTTTTTPTTA